MQDTALGRAVERVRGVIGSLPEPFTRSQVAAALGKNQLSMTEISALDYLVAIGDLVAKKAEYHSGLQFRVEYTRAKKRSPQKGKKP